MTNKQVNYTIAAACLLGAVFVLCVAIVGCGPVGPPKAQSISGVEMATVGKVETNAKGRTVEQENITERIKRDNEAGSLKHLYIISPYSGQVILYSPVKGKVTTGGKRLTPRAIDGVYSTSGNSTLSKPVVTIGGNSYTTSEIANEDGTFGGGDAPYLFWFEPNGKYHQFYLSGGALVHVSDQPLAVKSVIISTESADKK
jgi:hypothetical protein